VRYPGEKINWLWFFPGMEWAHPSGGKEKSIFPWMVAT